MRALIVGVTGQDGAYLAEFLLRKGYQVYGSSRDATVSTFSSLAQLGVRDRVECRSLAPNDFRSVFTVLTEVEPDEVYNLSGQSSVGLSSSSRSRPWRASASRHSTSWRPSG